MKRIIHIERAPNSAFFSIEKVFSIVRNGFPADSGVSVFKLPHPGLDIRNIMAVAKLRVSEPADTIFHVTGDAHYVVAALPGERTVLTMHDLVFLKQFHGAKLKLIELLYLKMPLWKKVRLTTISESTRNEFVKETGCSPDLISVIPNPVDETMAKGRAEKITGRRPRLLFVGVTPNKNLERVTEALEGLDVELVIIGKPAKEHLDLLSQRGIRVRSMHGLSEQEMADAYADADLVLFPSLYEGFGLVILEAFVAGVPVVTSDLSPMKDVAGGAACLVDPHDVPSIRAGVLKVLGDESYRRMLVDAGHEVVKLYSPASIATRYAELYSRMLQPNTKTEMTCAG